MRRLPRLQGGLAWLTAMTAVAAIVVSGSAGTIAETALAAATATTWMNVSGCAVPGGGAYDGPDWSQRPAQIGLTCDGAATITGARWQHWGAATADATGTLTLETCAPDCATGPRHRYHVALVASGVKQCGARRVYGVVKLHWTADGHPRTGGGPPQGCALAEA